MHWQPWDAAALAQAVEEDKPIMLSIGYAACHWCHVMATESFADATIAEGLNADFINIKVDREERPDIDQIYQSAHFIFTRRNGGWPLTMFLTPSGEPFFGGTYFPAVAQHGLPTFSEVLQRVTTAWREQRSAIGEQNKQVLPLLRSLNHYPDPASQENALHALSLQTAAAEFEQLFDAENGGLGEAPKFPHPVELAFCLHYGRCQQHESLLAKVHHTLTKMAMGGLQDHLAGGFFRYCVDAVWQVPHFEKMLYDNGLLLTLYADAAIAYQDATLRQTVVTTAEWALTQMRDEEGAFYAALDADSADGEGAFYLWGEEELKLALTPEEYTVFASHYGVHAGGARVEGKLHLTRRQSVAQTSAATSIVVSECTTLLTRAHDKLRGLRQQRLPPAQDDKILTAWNALMCHGLARSGRLLQNPQWQMAAQTAFDSTCRRLRCEQRTYAACRQNQRSSYGFLDDCAFLLQAALELLRNDFHPQTLNTAIHLAEELCTYYEDPAVGGFFFTANDGETLIDRSKSISDNALPSGNGIAITALLLLTQLTGDPRWQHAACRALKLFNHTLTQRASASASLLSALQCHLQPPTLVYLVGDSALCRQWQHALDNDAASMVLVFCLPPNHAELPLPLQKVPPEDGVFAYVCRDQSCSAPLTDFTLLQKMLAA